MVCGHDSFNRVFNEEDEGIPGDPNAVLGCMDPNANNYDELATHDTIAGLCTYDPVPGCTDEDALNYNEEATEDDDSCEYEEGMFSGFEDWQLALGAVILVLLLK